MIYINARFLTQKTTGVQRFAFELSKSLSNLRGDIVFLVSDLDEIFDKSALGCLNIKEIKGGRGHYWEQITLPFYLKSINNPLLVNLCNTAPVFYKNKISVVHDVTFLHYPESYSLTFRIAYKVLIPLIIKLSKRIVTVSNFSKKDLFLIYNLNPKNVEVVYNAVSKSFKPLLTCSKSNKNFALAVSSPNKHKNFSRMIDAFLKSNVSLDLKIIGSLSSTFSNQVSNISQDHRIKFLGRVDDETLIDLYQNAKFFIFPSLYEGFGIPPLEAQACGCPVISSNAASLPEVLGDSVLYFDPTNIDSIKSAIEKINSNADLQDKLILEGYENLKRFSWEKSAIKMNEIIKYIQTI